MKGQCSPSVSINTALTSIQQLKEQQEALETEEKYLAAQEVAEKIFNYNKEMLRLKEAETRIKQEKETQLVKSSFKLYAPE